MPNPAPVVPPEAVPPVSGPPEPLPAAVAAVPWGGSGRRWAAGFVVDRGPPVPVWPPVPPLASLDGADGDGRAGCPALTSTTVGWTRTTRLVGGPPEPTLTQTVSRGPMNTRHTPLRSASWKPARRSWLA